MNKTALVLAAMAFAGFSISSCSGESKKANTPSSTEAAAAEVSNIRFYSLDTIQNQYKLVEKLNAEADAAMQNYQSEERRLTNEIQRKMAQIEDKARNNGYLSEQSYNADMQDLQSKQNQAQNYLGNLQQQLALKAQEQQQMLLDSINNFLRDYNADHGYDAIFIITPGAYANPALDITEEIITGLNARYDKDNAASSDKPAEITATTTLKAAPAAK